ncbi:MAG: hypothetical protein KGJ37_06535 [Verrucomicrobiota bacterium]|nr:hypothetical protein [Verrucomicrobiota bacterium]
MGRSLLAGLVFFAIFVTGGVAGYFVGFRWAKLQDAQRRKDRQQDIAVPFNPQLMKRFADQLNLTAEQRGKIRPIIVQYAEEFRVLNREHDFALERMQRDIEKILTSDQRTKFIKLRDEQRHRLQEQREKVRRFLEERRAHNGREVSPAPSPPVPQPSPPTVSPSNPPAPTSTQPAPAH